MGWFILCWPWPLAADSAPNRNAHHDGPPKIAPGRWRMVVGCVAEDGEVSCGVWVCVSQIVPRDTARAKD